MSDELKPTISTVFFLKEIHTILYEGRRWEMYDASAEGVRYVSRGDCLEVIYHTIPLDQFNQLLASLREIKESKPFTIDKENLDGGGAYFRNIQFKKQ